jgi:hypothetical protein
MKLDTITKKREKREPDSEMPKSIYICVCVCVYVCVCVCVKPIL